MTVGTKQLKNRLSHYLRAVRAGHIVRVTDRGAVVAEIRAIPPTAKSDASHLRELEAQGLMTLGTGRFDRVQAVRLRRGVRAAKAILDDRG